MAVSGMHGPTPSSWKGVLGITVIAALLIVAVVGLGYALEDTKNSSIAVESTSSDTSLAKKVVKGTLLQKKDSSIWVVQKTMNEGANKVFFDSHHSIYFDRTKTHPPSNSIDQLQQWIASGEVKKVIPPDHPQHKLYASWFVRQTIP